VKAPSRVRKQFEAISACGSPRNSRGRKLARPFRLGMNAERPALSRSGFAAIRTVESVAPPSNLRQYPSRYRHLSNMDERRFVAKARFSFESALPLACALRCRSRCVPTNDAPCSSRNGCTDEEQRYLPSWRALASSSSKGLLPTMPVGFGPPSRSSVEDPLGKSAERRLQPRRCIRASPDCVERPHRGRAR